MTNVLIVDYGAGNTRSVRAALSHLGHDSVVSSDPERILSSEFVLLPGVGSARSAMQHLEQTGAAQALKDRFAAHGRILGICLGMQLALESSEEDGGVTGLGLLSGTVRRLEIDRVPRLGWAVVQPWNEAFYFAHSFACQSEETIATSDGIAAAVHRGSFLGVQFHPEKSGPAGLAFLEKCLLPA